MGLRERHAALLKWLTPRRRCQIGGGLAAVWVAGLLVHPGQYLTYIVIVASVILTGAWSPASQGKR
ncbi:hypothetical protein DFS21_10992 [Pseudomonas sp. 2848]|jgi:hypothetical protein|uniref:Uncharacterized protein n=1 Tax=Pseudomonas soli TaxID=1306993 RepID=A0A2V4IF48_9PSED|nr:hypothetical protein DMX07_15910 [Pseudomonas soli]PZW77333.1 hypothetical protein DFS21_10992 [Pseudomonas sp. 2848]